MAAIQEERLAVSVTEAARLLSVSRPTLYSMIYAGQLPSVKAGKRRLISMAALRSYLAGEEQPGAA